MTARLRFHAWWSALWDTGYPQAGDTPFRTWLVFRAFRAYRSLVGRPVRPFVVRSGRAWRVTDRMPGLFVQLGRLRLLTICGCVTISQEPMDSPPLLHRG